MLALTPTIGISLNSLSIYARHANDNIQGSIEAHAPAHFIGAFVLIYGKDNLKLFQATTLPEVSPRFLSPSAHFAESRRNHVRRRWLYANAPACPV